MPGPALEPLPQPVPVPLAGKWVNRSMTVSAAYLDAARTSVRTEVLQLPRTQHPDVAVHKMHLALVFSVFAAAAMSAEAQFWPSSQDFLGWFRQPRTAAAAATSLASSTAAPTTQPPPTTTPQATDATTLSTLTTLFTVTTTDRLPDTTATGEDDAVTLESRDYSRLTQYFPNKREKPQVKIASNISQNLLPLPAGAGAALVKPTKYHYYPHNQHIYLLPECAIQQVCNAVYVRLNWTQPLCACPSRYRDPCSASLNSDDLHTTELITDPTAKRALTLVKTCEPTADMRVCRTPRDWSLLALQNIRTGKSHYLVICRCPDSSILEGPMSHDQPTYASVPGIRVYGMMCVTGRRRGRPLRMERALPDPPLPMPWDKIRELVNTANWD